MRWRTDGGEWFQGGQGGVAAGVVLYYRSEGQQAEAAALIPLGTSTTSTVVDQPRAQLGAVKGRAPTAGPDSRSPNEGGRYGGGNAGYAD